MEFDNNIPFPVCYNFTKLLVLFFALIQVGNGVLHQKLEIKFMSDN